jgi:hypothetical protein
MGCAIKTTALHKGRKELLLSAARYGTQKMLPSVKYDRLPKLEFVQQVET